MKIFVGVTDERWYEYVRSLPNIDEVNFWRPTAETPFKALDPGDLFLFKLHSPRDYIAGGGFFVHFTILPISLAWEAFGEKNGAPTYGEMRQRIIPYRRGSDDRFSDFRIGCILLTQPFFLDEADWFRPPEWSPNIVRGKGYDSDSEAGRYIWDRVSPFLEKKKAPTIGDDLRLIEEEHSRYGREVLVRPRLGQGAFKVIVTDAYNRSCAITRERALPVLEAGHIKPFAESGPHDVRNGILLRSDMHRLFDKGYLTVTPKLHIEVSRRIREEFDNGEYYFTFHGKEMAVPRRPFDRPSPEFLEWHNEKVFRG